MTNKLAYRADIDGLRAVAVLAVIASHLPEKLLPSGFLGVDVFFAISGFVVTGSLMGQRRTTLGHLYIGFLARRVKRLLPALALLVAVTGLIVLSTDPFPRHSTQTGLAALFGFANIVLFFFELDYFSPSAVFNAFTHTWSLGVEEQFYVVFPMFAWLFYFRLKADSYRPLAIAMIVGGVVSLAMFVLLYDDHQPAAFFLMPARIWELGVGSLVYLASRNHVFERWRPLLRRASPLALIALITVFFVPEHYSMPATIPAVALTALLLASDGRGFAARSLESSPVVYIGKISYSLYLWHWPVIALGPIVLATQWRTSTVYVVIMTLAAIASFHLVEHPLRYLNWTSRRIRDIGAGLAGNLIIAAALLFMLARTGAGIGSTDLHPPAYVPILHNGKSHVLTCALDGGSRQLQDDTIDNCTVAPQADMPTVWTMGDSHSGHLQGLLFEVHERLGVGVHLVETPGWPYPFEPGTSFEPRVNVFEQISSRFRRGDIVLLSRIYLSRTPPYEQLELRPWIYQVSRLADELDEMDVKLVVTGPPPLFPFDDIRECNLEERDSCRMRRDKLEQQVENVNALLGQLAASKQNVAIFDMFEPACPSADDYCYPDDGTSFLYRDKDHFNSLGSQRLAEPFVDLLRNANMLAPVE